MVGRASRPMVTTVAPTMPVEAASSAPTTITEMDNPPRKRPKRRAIVSNSSSANPERSRVTPMNTNNGTATRVKLFITPQMRRGSRLKNPNPNPSQPNNSASDPMVKATG